METKPSRAGERDIRVGHVMLEIDEGLGLVRAHMPQRRRLDRIVAGHEVLHGWRGEAEIANGGGCGLASVVQRLTEREPSCRRPRCGQPRRRWSPRTKLWIASDHTGRAPRLLPSPMAGFHPPAVASRSAAMRRTPPSAVRTLTAPTVPPWHVRDPGAEQDLHPLTAHALAGGYGPHPAGPRPPPPAPRPPPTGPPPSPSRCRWW